MSTQLAVTALPHILYLWAALWRKVVDSGRSIETVLLYVVLVNYQSVGGYTQALIFK